MEKAFSGSIEIPSDGTIHTVQVGSVTTRIITFLNRKPIYTSLLGDGEVYDPVSQVGARIYKIPAEPRPIVSFVWVDFETSEIRAWFSKVTNLSSNYTVVPFFFVTIGYPDEYFCIHSVQNLQQGQTKEDMRCPIKSFAPRNEFSLAVEWGVTNLNSTVPSRLEFCITP